MKPIGGYFELELPPPARCRHPRALAYATGRACVAAILDAMSPSAVHVPAWACEALYEPMRRASVPLRLYGLGPTLAPAPIPRIRPGELLVLINAFGTLDAVVAELAAALGDGLVVDNTQAFFAREIPGAWAFNSARKFFGVPDGAYLYPPRRMAAPAPADSHLSVEHLIARLGGDPEAGYRGFREHEVLLSDAQPGMSRLAARILAAVDYRRVAETRRRNYALLHARLGSENRLEADLDAVHVPMCYPFLPRGRLEREVLIARRIFVPRFWQSVLDRPGDDFAWERQLAARLLPLPVDQRYGEEDMEHVARTVLELRSQCTPGTPSSC